MEINYQPKKLGESVIDNKAILKNYSTWAKKK